MKNIPVLAALLVSSLFWSQVKKDSIRTIEKVEILVK